MHALVTVRRGKGFEFRNALQEEQTASIMHSRAVRIA